MTIKVYTDGSAHPPSRLGAWAFIIMVNHHKTSFKGIEENTTHQRMELLSVIKALKKVPQLPEYQLNKDINLVIYSDSQYVVGLLDRREKIQAQNYKTKSSVLYRNVDLLKIFFHLLEKTATTMVKVKAHQKITNTINPNREVDKMCRQLLRKTLRQYN